MQKREGERRQEREGKRKRTQVEGGAMFSFLMKARKMRKTLAQRREREKTEREREAESKREGDNSLSPSYTHTHTCVSRQAFIDLL